MTLELDGSKKKIKTQSSPQHMIIEFDLFTPNDEKYPIYNFEKLRKEQLGEESSGDDDPDDLKFLRSFQSKYEGKSHPKKKMLMGKKDDFANESTGYELDEPSRDDWEPYDDMIPSHMDTAKGGYYVNHGKLEFVDKFKTADRSGLSNDESSAKKANKRSRQQNHELENERDEPSRKISKPSSGTASATTPVPPSRPSMTGVPPSENHTPSPPSTNKLSAKIVKKRPVDTTPTGRVPKLVKIKMPAPIPITDTVTPAPAVSTPTSISSPVSFAASTPTPAEEASTAFSTPKAATTRTPKTNPFPTLSETLSVMIDNFKLITERLAPPGQKKRLQTDHIDMLIAVEDQSNKDGLSAHQRSAVTQMLADFVGIQRNSLYSRIHKRKEELKNSSNGIPKAPGPHPSLSSSKAKNKTESTATTGQQTPLQDKDEKANLAAGKKAEASAEKVRKLKEKKGEVEETKKTANKKTKQAEVERQKKSQEHLKRERKLQEEREIREQEEPRKEKKQVVDMRQNIPQSSQFAGGSTIAGPCSKGMVVRQSPLQQKMEQSPMYQMKQLPMVQHNPHSPITSKVPQKIVQQPKSQFDGFQQQQNPSLNQKENMQKIYQHMMQQQLQHQQEQPLVQQRQLQQHPMEFEQQNKQHGLMQQMGMIRQHRQPEHQGKEKEQRQAEQQRFLLQQAHSEQQRQQQPLRAMMPMQQRQLQDFPQLQQQEFDGTAQNPHSRRYQ